MKQLPDKELDKKLKGKLADHQFAPPEDAWQAIEQELHPPATGNKPGRIMLLKRVSLYAAVLAGILIAAAGIWLLKKPAGTLEEVARLDSAGSKPEKDPKVTIFNNSRKKDQEQPEKTSAEEGALVQEAEAGEAPVQEKAPDQEIMSVQEDQSAQGDVVLASGGQEPSSRHTGSPGRSLEKLAPIKLASLPVLQQQEIVLAPPIRKSLAPDAKGKIKKKNLGELNGLADVMNILALIDPREQKFISIEKDKETEKVKRFRLDLGEIAITYNPRNKVNN